MSREAPSLRRTQNPLSVYYLGGHAGEPALAPYLLISGGSGQRLEDELTCAHRHLAPTFPGPLKVVLIKVHFKGEMQMGFIEVTLAGEAKVLCRRSNGIT